MGILGIASVVVVFLALAAVLSLIPALIVMLGFNWIAPTFGCHIHLAFWQTWVALFVLGIVGRTVFGSGSGESK